jgi:hypothetical protein
MERRSKFWCAIAREVTVASDAVLYISKKLEERILNVFTTKK